MKKVFVGFGIGFALLASVESAFADSWCDTRNKCRWWRPKYAANAVVGCIGISLPLCFKHSVSCGTADANCGYKSCLVGGGTSRATNSSSGCVTSKSRSGLGVAGIPLPDAFATDSDSGNSRVVSSSTFDDANKTVLISLSEGTMTSARGSMPERLTAYVFREADGVEGQKDDGGPVRTAENTIWTGSIVVADGNVRVSGFNTEGISVSTDAAGNTTARLSGMRAFLPLNVSDADFENLVVQVVLDEVQLTK